MFLYKNISGDKVVEKLPDYLTEDEVNKIINTASKNHKHWLILQTLWETGMRAEELTKLKAEHIVPPDSQHPPLIHVYGKGKKERFIPISNNLYNLLRIYLGNKKKGYVFTNKQGKQLTTTAIRLIVYKYAEKAGITRFKIHPHTFRHSRAVHLLKKGMALNELQLFLGHSNLETTAIYLKILPKEMIESYQKIVEGGNE